MTWFELWIKSWKFSSGYHVWYLRINIHQALSHSVLNIKAAHRSASSKCYLSSRDSFSWTELLPPANEVCEGCFHRCLSLHRGMSVFGPGGCLPHPPAKNPRSGSLQLDTPGQIPLCPVHAGIHTPHARCMLGYTPHPPAQCILGYMPPAQCIQGYGQQASGTHPTGMHSCFMSCIRPIKLLNRHYLMQFTTDTEQIRIRTHDHVLVEENLTDFTWTFIWKILHRDKHIVTHVLTAQMSEHRLLLTITIGNETLQSQQLPVAKEMSSSSDGSRHHDVTITSLQQQILDVTFQILPYYGNCVVSCVSDLIPNLDLN